MGVRAMKHAALLQAWSGRIATCRSSGKTVKEWCESEGISIKTYYYWEKKIVTEAIQGAKLPVTALGNTLVRVNPDAMASGETAAPYAMVRASSPCRSGAARRPWPTW